MNTFLAFFSGRQKNRLMLLSLLLGLALLSGCDNHKETRSSAEAAIEKFEHTTILEGYVSNNKRRLKLGAIKATDSDNRLVAITHLKNTAHYEIEIPAGTVLPIVLTFYADIQEGAEKMTVAVVDADIIQYDINPLTTAIAKRAMALGGYSHVNMMRAAEESVHVPDANKTTAGFKGDTTKQYGGWH
ncbi:hypothetical protein JCM14076_19440 [Methylosoma difficile]